MWQEGRGGREGMQVHNSAIALYLPTEKKHNRMTDSKFEYVLMQLNLRTQNFLPAEQ